MIISGATLAETRAAGSVPFEIIWNKQRRLNLKRSQPNTEHIVFHSRAAGLVPRPEPRAPRASQPVASIRRSRDRADVGICEMAEPSLAFARQVLTLAGLDATAYRARPLIRRTPACLRALNCQTVEQACELVENDQAALRAAMEVLLIGVTWFCRDSLAIDALQEVVRSSSLTHWRVWSAGCSEGAELYSVAMLLDDAGKLEGSSLLGTDCRPAAVEQARSGRYSVERIRELPTGFKSNYVFQDRGKWVVHERLRAAAQWRTDDLLDGQWRGDQSKWDLILCRNVAIYLSGDATGRLWQGLADSLAPGGYLVAGKAERPEREAPLRRVGTCIYQKLEKS